ncbi:pantoate--beta-alanine ligase [Subsaximicrobium wynnwilliamsii]|uniref:Pantothenate synthetase n=1 Tax=Subsaximicrobium wynnwilliamsii TaxID=291179 RepID=A0A5C6ZDZ7_9FLAO|nr:pantoate--beta-alanine ligase [Subsaximicrobium wynnwilliamsii]TXD82513.1 pantoate--beta-alanine ligase [Subsaximicrobium wynnwilliamsii]TXD88156.1 pantoate--beta-alanine ligase [Subsaximicrobium wynnwilliamsii]TXE02171.1 pantoate--beta-alanine ligase [Subsaximicrobium wynnwilliamsii]
MKIFENKEDLTVFLDAKKNKGLAVGLVPTMGALHEGHVSLISKGLADNDLVVVSIFVNPTQFDKEEDLIKYPRTLASDIALLKTVSEETILVFAPSVADIYGTTVASQHFDYDGLEHEMEGRFRNGHFDGVGTIVKRLFEIVKPQKAYFGEKDFQQLMIIKKLVAIEKLPVDVVGCDIYRANDGLAMSSRNMRLAPEYREAAPFIYKMLQAAKTKFATDSAQHIIDWVNLQFENNELLELEYFIIANAETLKSIENKTTESSFRAFIAVYADGVRLIDNIALN